MEIKMKILVSVLLLVSLIGFTAVKSDAEENHVHAIASNLKVYQGDINGAILEHDDNHLVFYGDPRSSTPTADTVLFTHHRRDVVWAGQSLADQGAHAYIPLNEKHHFTQVEEFWQNFLEKRFHDYAQQTTKIITHPFENPKTVQQGDVINWFNHRIMVIDTPGYTRGSVTYLLTLENQKIAFPGDLIYGDGQLFDLYSLQDEIDHPQIGLRGYHGYAARASELITSLRKILDYQPDVLIPIRGPIVHNPTDAINKLIARLQSVYRNYLSICALRWYFGDEHIQASAARVLDTTQVDWMPMAETVNPEPPEWIIPIYNSRLIISETGSAILVDCGGDHILNKVKELQQAGKFSEMKALYISHYHDDHTDHAQQFSAEFNCPVYCCEELEDILVNPTAYQMPAMTNNPIQNLKVMPEGTVLDWEEFKLTFSFYPGQTLYHGGLLVEKNNGESIFFVGDTFTPSGIDDYCLHNRNLLHEDSGYLYCLNHLNTLDPNTLLINQHVNETFRFSPEQIDFMINALHERTALLKDLFPWEDPNYGIDHKWAHFYPYEVQAQHSEPFELKIVILNHANKEKQYSVTLNLPANWKVDQQEKTLTLAPREQGTLRYTITPSSEAQGLSIVTADIKCNDKNLRHWIESMIKVN